MYTQLFIGIALFAMGFITKKNNPLFVSGAVSQLKEPGKLKSYLKTVGNYYMILGAVFIFMSQGFVYLDTLKIPTALFIAVYVLAVSGCIALILMTNHKFTGKYFLAFAKRSK